MAQLPDTIDWTAARVFLAVARTGSLTAAARRLGMSQPTVSRHLQAFEEVLDIKLFVRHARGVRLTDGGAPLVAVAEAVEQAMDGFQRVATGVREHIAGTVRLATSEIVGIEVIVPRLGELRAAHPGIELDLVLANTTSDLIRGEADIAVRLYRPQEVDLVTKRLGSVTVALFAARTYLDRCGVPDSIAALLEHTLIGFDRRGPMARSFEFLDPRFSADRCAIRTDSLTAQLAAVRAGLGIAALQSPIAARYPELIPIPLPGIAPEMPFWLTTHSDLRQAPHIGAVWSFCDQILSDYLD